MSIVAAARRSLAVTVALKLSIIVLALTIIGGVTLTFQQRSQLEQATLEKARVATAIGAQQYGEILDREIDAGTLTVADAFDKNYVLIKGYEWGSAPKHHSRFDAVTDRAVLLLQDQFLEDPDFVFAIGVDENGYIPTHNSKFTQPFTGVPEKDLLGNRTKRIANYPLGLAAARTLEPSLVQIYTRDGGEKMWDVASPIYVKGKHWGALRVGVSMERIAARQRSLALALTGMFAVFFVVTVGTMFVVVQNAMKPVVALTAKAEQISLGEELEVPIKSDAVNEIGQLTKTIDRLRASMKAAMSRLGH